MSPDLDLSYTRQELLDYLPGGWVLGDPMGAGGWNERKSRWEVTVTDTADVDWALCVDARAAAKSGRIEALRDAVDELYREALGAPGFFG